MKKIVLVFLAVFQLAIFCACDFGAYTHVHASSKSAFVLAGYNIPGASEGLSVDVQLVEEDAYGRKMYRFSCLSPIGDFYADSYNEEEATNIRAYLISQKETEKGVYYLDSVKSSHVQSYSGRSTFISSTKSSFTNNTLL